MPKSAPKMKPISTKKKKLPMMVLGLLGLALLLAGSVAAIGLMQLNQDSRSNASSSCSSMYGSERAICEQNNKKARDAAKEAARRENDKNQQLKPGDATSQLKYIQQQNEKKAAAEAEAKKQQEAARRENDKNQQLKPGDATSQLKYIQQQNEERAAAAARDSQREGERASYAKQAEQFKNDAAKEAAKAADAELAASRTTNPVEKAKYTAAATQARAKQATNEQKAAQAVAKSQQSSSGGSSNSNSKKTLGQPVEVTAVCEGDKVMRLKWRMVNGTADTFILAANSTALVPGSSQCQTLMDGWRCQGDIQNEIKLSSAGCNSRGECSAKISVWRTHTYDFVAVRAVMGGATKVGQASVSLKCN